MQPQSTPPLNGQDIDRETFRRVWERVMPGSASPIAVDSPGGGEDGERALPTSSGPAREEAAAAQTRAPVPRCPSEEQRPPVPSCAPEEQPPLVPSCGQEPSLSYVPSCGPCRPCGASRTGQPPAPPAEDSGAGLRLLEELLDTVQAGLLQARALARRSGGGAGRVLADLAAGHRQALRRLGTAYFLITGRRFRSGRAAPAATGSLALGLREQFMWERQWERLAQQGSLEAEDPCLKALYQQLAREGALHAQAIRSLLEQMT